MFHYVLLRLFVVELRANASKGRRDVITLTFDVTAYVIVLHPYTKFEVHRPSCSKDVGMWLIFGHGVNRVKPGDLDL